MQVSLETTSGLERRLTVGIPADVIDGEVKRRLLDAAKNVRINGFRKGKVPMSVVRQRFGEGVRQEVLGDVINRSLNDAFRKENLRPAGRPNVEPKQLAEGKDLEYVATFEVYPAIELKGLEGIEITRLSAEIGESDVDDMIETLRKSQAKWEDVTRAAASGDRVVIDFVGTQGGVAFEGGAATGHTLTLGSNTMIPGFEAGIEGMVAGETRDVAVTFPADYQNEALKGTGANFAVALHGVSAEVLPEINEELFAVFGIRDGDLERFRQEVKVNMENEQIKATKNRLKSAVFDALLSANQCDIPNSLVGEEIEALRSQALQQYGQLSAKLDVKSLLPDELFKAQAERRTALGLLISEVIVKHEIKPEKDRVRGLIESAAATYEDPQGVVSYYYSNQELLAGVEAAAMEEQVMEVLLGTMNVVEKTVPYQELIRPTTAEAV